LDILGHDGDSLGVDGAKVGVLKESDKVGFGSFLKGRDGGSLESKLGLEVLGDFSDKPLEGQLADQEFSALLETTDLSESDGSGPESMGFLDTSSLDRGLAGGLVSN